MSHVLKARLAGEAGLPGQRGEQRFLDDVLGEVVVAKLQLRDAQQVAAVGVEFGGETAASIVSSGAGSAGDAS